MQYVEVAEARVSKIGLGCWQFGSREWGYGRDYAHDEAIRITHKALDLGINLIDTAEIYGFGQSERIVGRAITGRRDEAFVATKIWPLMPVAPLVVDRGRRSARRLKIDTIDLYQVHQANPFVPDGTTMDGMRRLHATVWSAMSASATTPSIDGIERNGRSVRPSSATRSNTASPSAAPIRIWCRSPPRTTG